MLRLSMLLTVMGLLWACGASPEPSSSDGAPAGRSTQATEPAEQASDRAPKVDRSAEAQGMVIEYLTSFRVSEFETCFTIHEGVSAGDYSVAAHPEGDGYLVAHETRFGNYQWRVWPESGTVAIYERPEREGIC